MEHELKRALIKKFRRSCNKGNQDFDTLRITIQMMHILVVIPGNEGKGRDQIKKDICCNCKYFNNSLIERHWRI